MNEIIGYILNIILGRRPLTLWSLLGVFIMLLCLGNKNSCTKIIKLFNSSKLNLQRIDIFLCRKKFN